MCRAVHLLRYPVTLGKFPRRKDPVQVTYGMYGPYVHQGRTNVTLRDIDPDAVTLEQAIEMVRDKEANPRPAMKQGRRQKATSQDAKATDASAAGSETRASDDKSVAASAGRKASAKSAAKPRKAAAKTAGKATGKAAGGVKAGKTKAKPAAKKGQATSKASKAQSTTGGKSAWSTFLAAHIPELKEQQPDITFGDVRPFSAAFMTWYKLPAHVFRLHPHSSDQQR